MKFVTKRLHDGDAFVEVQVYNDMIRN